LITTRDGTPTPPQFRTPRLSIGVNECRPVEFVAEDEIHARARRKKISHETQPDAVMLEPGSARPRQ
jgi:hypothetical protein